jgi:hypothetical protein
MMIKVSRQLLFIIAVVLILCGPIITIWALNTLFPVLDIPVTLSTWLAVWVIKGSGIAINMGRK